jgi:uncharacterized protein
VSRLLKRGWWVLLAVPLLLGLSRLRFDVQVLNLLPDRVPVVHGLKLYQENFAGMRELILTVRAPEAEAAEAAARQVAEGLRQETNLVASVVWQPPWLEHPEQMPELLGYLWLNQPPEALAQLRDRLAPDKLDALLREAREQLATSLSPLEIGRLGYDPFGFTRLPETGPGGDMFSAPQEGFASADGVFRVIYIEARGELQGYRACAAWLGGIQAVVGRCRTAASWPGQVTVRYTGAPAFTTEIGTGMERDMQGAVLSTLVLIIVLFWWAHRSWRPLLWLMVMLGLVLCGTLASGGLIFGRLNAVSLGFAAILLGLAVDYGLVLYQEAVAAPHLSARELRGLLGSGIVWSALTTAAAFALLNFAGLPGLSQLGSLVAIGILLAAVVMLYVFLPLVRRRLPSSSAQGSVFAGGRPHPAGGPLRLTRAVTLLAAGAAVLILWRAWPQVEHSTSPLQPKQSAAQVALDELQAVLRHQGDPLLLVVTGVKEEDVASRLDALSAHLARAATNQGLRSFALPTALWPHSARQQQNRVTASALAARSDALSAAALRAGFTPEALGLKDGLLRTWRQYGGVTNVVWPTNQASSWLLKRATAWSGREWLAVGAIQPGTNRLSAARLAELNPGLPGVWLTGWSLLGEALLEHVEHRLRWVMAAMAAMIGLCLWLAFRRWWEVLLSTATLGFSLLLLLAVMGLAGWSWNLMNLMALPLLLGAGVDYTIHVQLALRRHAGDIVTMRRVTGRAIFLCAATTVAGFGSNAFSSNAGLASLGLVCSTGIALVYLTSIFLLPAWWCLFQQSAMSQHPASQGVVAPAAPAPSAPIASSALYRTWLWRLGLAVARLLPAWLVNALFVGLGTLCSRVQPRRRAVVIQNLLPALGGDGVAAEQTAGRLYRNFARKLADLWRFESGVAERNWVTRPADRNLIQAVCARGRGVLFITLHLGNWEHGGLLLSELGIKLTVLTLAEPDDGLTELRIASRARWGIESLIIGQDSFAFVEVIKRLQGGAAVAISIDRPPERGAVPVELFGRPFAASTAAAELARASGCALVGVTVVRVREGYAVTVLPEFTYDRQALGQREARRELTQQILRAFEPQIRQHLDQWYHFVPIWPGSDAS